MGNYFGSFQIARMLYLRSLAIIYLTAFVSSLNQFPELLGKHGFLPTPQFLVQVSWQQSPSIFHFYYSDPFFAIIAWVGIILSAIAVLGISEKTPWWTLLCHWLTLWFLYLSIVNVGQTFYSFGWESMILEAGFFAAFLGSSKMAAALIPVLALRWMLFRTEMGAGLIKLRGDTCWRDLTCLIYHHETQPMPNPLSWFFHQIPAPIMKAGVVFSHFVQVLVPFGLFAPQRIAAMAGLLIILHQLILIMGGNYSWLNWLTVILGLTAFSDSIFSIFSVKTTTPTIHSRIHTGLVCGLGILTLILSIQPTLNFFSERQLMNFSYNRYHLVGSYGAFGSVTKKRYEIILEGTRDSSLSPQTIWQEYEFKAKPGRLDRQPPQFAPYHLRLDWLMWFLPFSVHVTPHGIYKQGYQIWFLRFARQLLRAHPQTLRLLSKDPFDGLPPNFVRAQFYLYQFTSPEEKSRTGNWWKRQWAGEYMPPVNLEALREV